MKTLYVIIILPLFLVAQNTNVRLLANLNKYPARGYSDCWGYAAPDGREYALLGVNGGVSIVDVTDTSNIAEVDYVPFVNHSWYDMKTRQNYLYVTSEGTTEILVVDLSGLPDSTRVVGLVPSFGTTPHNNYVDPQAGLLYGVEDFNIDPSVRIFDLGFPTLPLEIATISPANNGVDAHDVYARGNRLYIAEGSSGSLGIFDMSNPSQPVLLQRVSILSPGYVHNVWVSEDNRYLISTEETPNKTVKLWDIQDLDNITLISEYLGDSRLAHNAYIRGDYAYISHYESGVKIVDLSVPSDMVAVGAYDTYPPSSNPDFNGAWGVYPFSPSGLIFASDIQTGLYVLKFDSVRAAAVEGIVTDVQSGLPVEGMAVSSLEAGKTVLTGAAGFYRLRTFAGAHTLVFSRLGYFPDSVSVSLNWSQAIMQNIALEPNLADIRVSLDSLSVLLPVNATFDTTLVVSNEGPAGRLDYTIDDINGPFPTRLPQSRQQRGDWRAFNFRIDPQEIERLRPPRLSLNRGTLQGDTILVDPPGDLVFGTGGDVVALLATNTGSEVIFELVFANPVNTDSTFAVLALDVDFDAATGAFPGGFGFNLPSQNTGSEFDLLLDIPGAFFPFPNAAALFVGSNAPGDGPLLAITTAQVNGNVITVAVSLADIGDDGNLAVAGYTGHLDANNPLPPASIDYLPNIGNGQVGINPLGDLPWLSLSRSGGSLFTGESDTVTLSFDTNGLDPGQEFSGIIVIQSNDPDETILLIPVSLMTQPPVGIGESAALPARFFLEQNYPNPFNPATTIRFGLPQSVNVKLEIFNLLGQRVAVLLDEHKSAGNHRVVLNGGNLPSGLYVYRLKAGHFTKSRRMLLIK